MNTMALYFIGDIQGCDAALQRLLDALDFSPSRDTLYLLGDLVNRGPASAQVLRRLMGLGHSARTVLGNHDLSLLALAYGARRAKRGDTLQPVLDAPDRAAMLDWLRQQPLALQEHGCLMVHAGVLPQWTTAQTLALAQEVTTVLRSTHTGFIRDLEGSASRTVVDADISFHAIREYAPGDSPRQIHWKSRRTWVVSFSPSATFCSIQ